MVKGEEPESLNYIYDKYKHLDPIIMDLDSEEDIEIYFRMLCDCWKAIKDFVK